jgi:carbamoyl-phosphate synthase/aspartate carbamoyltransferase/dihydroorotase
MPNTQPPITDKSTFNRALVTSSQKARCDYSLFLGAGADNADSIPPMAPLSAGLKMYLDQTYGELHLADMVHWMAHFSRWPKGSPIAVHAEGSTLGAVILIAALHDRPVHLCHVSKREEILLIRSAKEKGFKVTCEVCPHHLFLNEDDIPAIGTGRAEVRPRLGRKKDQEALWGNLEVIDCFATDHAPHTLTEKDSDNPPPGFPGLETALPLFLTAIAEGRLTLDDLITRLHTNPTRIFNIPPQPDTFIEIDPAVNWDIQAANTYTRCAWTPFENWHVRGRVQRVVLRGVDAFKDGEVLAEPGFGKDIRDAPKSENHK